MGIMNSGGVSQTAAAAVRVVVAKAAQPSSASQVTYALASSSSLAGSERVPEPMIPPSASQKLSSVSSSPPCAEKSSSVEGVQSGWPPCCFCGLFVRRQAHSQENPRNRSRCFVRRCCSGLHLSLLRCFRCLRSAFRCLRSAHVGLGPAPPKSSVWQ